MVFDIKPDDVYWCAADIGWVTGHSYIVYGPLANATTGVLYEGAPDTPDWDRWWQIVEDYKVTILYCAPTAIRDVHEAGRGLSRASTTSRSLRVLGSVGEPINPEAWLWYHEHIGGGEAPDRGHLVADGDRHDPDQRRCRGSRPRSPARPRSRCPGSWRGRRRRARRRACPLGGGGYLVLTRPWPSMLRGIYGDPERYRATYWSRFPGMYFAGDGAKRDADGLLLAARPGGRRDERRRPPDHARSRSSRRWWTIPRVAEAAVVGKIDELTGQAIFAFVTLRPGQAPRTALAVQLREHVAYVIGPIARPKFLLFTPDLPKTRSGKIMRRLLRDIAEGRTLGDTTTLADAGVVETIREHSGQAED